MPRHGLPIGSDVDNQALLRLAGQEQIADLIWEAPAEFTTEHRQLGAATIQAHLSGRLEEGTHRDPLRAFALVRGSLINSLRPSRTNGS